MTPTEYRHLDEFERDIKRLQIEYARYFAGDLDRPPTEIREELTARVRQLRLKPNPSTAERFRLNSLIARLNTLGELFDRRLRNHRGRDHHGARAKDAVVAGSERGTKAVRRLFLELYKEETPAATITSFEKFLEKQVSDIKSRTGCSSVQFRVIENDGRRSLRAKPLGKAQAPSNSRRSS